MSFGGSPSKPRKPDPIPQLATIEPGSVMEKKRRKLAQGRSGTNITRGLLFEKPMLQSPMLTDKLGG